MSTPISVTGPRSLATRLKGTAKDWLDRPMTSWHLIVAIFFLLLGFGLLMVLSASAIYSFHTHNGAPFAEFENQALFAVIGMFGFLFASRFSTRVMRSLSFPLVAVCLLLLAVVLVVGRRINGAQSWIDLGPIQFQPSEVAKLALLIWMSHVLAARRNTLRSIRQLLFPVLPVFLVMVALIMLEPDLGTTVSLGIVFIAVLWFGGAPWWMFAFLTASGGAVIVYLATSAGYRSLRVLAWLHPAEAVKLDGGAIYQITQSYIGLGHGGIFGAGLGQSVAKAGWLPNADSDFIFAVIGEELGLIGAGLVLLLFGLLAYTGLRIARRNVDPFIKIIASAATIWLVGQAAINIGYVVGLLPVTGIPLPMISRGGTSLVITMVVFGMLANFARREPQATAALRSQGPGLVAKFLGLGVKPPKPPKAGRRSRQARKAAAKNITAPAKSRSRNGSARPIDRRSSARTARSAESPRLARSAQPARPARRRPAPEDPRRATPLPVTDWEGRSFVEPRSAAGRAQADPMASRAAQRRPERSAAAKDRSSAQKDRSAGPKDGRRGGRETGRGAAVRP